MDSATITTPGETTSGAVIDRVRMASDPKVLERALNSILKGLVFNGCYDLRTVKVTIFEADYVGVGSLFIRARGQLDTASALADK